MYKSLFLYSACLFIFSCKPNTNSTVYSGVDTIHVINSQLESISLYKTELTAKKTLVFDSVKGKLLFEIFPNISIESTEPSNDWCQVGLYTKASDEEFDKYKIFPNRKLYGVNGYLIGQTIDTVDIWLDYGELAFIGGYTSLQNILIESKPEYVLEQYLFNNKSTIDDLKPYLDSFGFEKIDLNPNWKYATYMIYESQIQDPSPIDRIILFFDNNGDLKCSVNSRDAFGSKYPKLLLKRDRTLNNLGLLSVEEISNISNLMNEIYSNTD